MWRPSRMDSVSDHQVTRPRMEADESGEYRTILQLVSVLSHGKGEWRTEWQSPLGPADTWQRLSVSRTKSSI
jgi:hypothetical protein